MHAGWFRSSQAWHLAPRTTAGLLAAKIHPCGPWDALVHPLPLKHPARPASSCAAPQCLQQQARYLGTCLGGNLGTWVVWHGAAPRPVCIEATSKSTRVPWRELSTTLSSLTSYTQLPPRAWPGSTLPARSPLARKVRLVATHSHPSPQDGGSKDEQESDAPRQKEGAEEGTASG